MASSRALKTLLMAALVAAAAGQEDAAAVEEDFQCPADEPTGRFADTVYCDAYWSCRKGKATFVECADGLAFSATRAETLKEPCDSLINVDCTGLELGPPQGTAPCTRRFGTFPHENPEVCDKYYTCEDNVATEQPCPPGLHFRLDTETCDWPTAAKRGTCTGRQQLKDGFQCDSTLEFFTPAGQKIVHPTFPHPDDCRLFYTCLNGVKPQLSQCSYQLVYNLEKSVCTAPEEAEVECRDYYANDTEEQAETDPNTQ